MISFPNCKVNLGLHIVEKRSDGYHNLETVFYPLPLTDVLEIIPSPDTSSQSSADCIAVTGLTVAGDPQANLCFKAWQLLQADFPALSPVKIHLHKNIPMGAGLGGGSSDGAFTLRMLNHIFQLGLGNDELAAYALRLGSDCPFFIYNSPTFAEGRGEIFREIELDLSIYSWLIVNPRIHIGTPQAFSRIKPAKAPIDLASAVKQPVDQWKGMIKNDFEEPAFFYYPDLRSIKEWLYEAGALYAAMTGSGSCFYGLFAKGQLPQGSPAGGWELHRII